MPEPLNVGNEILNTVMQKARGAVNYQTLLDNINWSRSYKWRVNMDLAPYPFDPKTGMGLPVVDVTDIVGYGNTLDMEQSISWVRVPRDRGKYEIVMNMFDTEDGLLERYFEDWFNSIYDPDEGVEYVTNAMRAVKIERLNSMDEVVFSRTFYCYPYQPIRGYNKQNDSSPRRFELYLIVVDYLGRRDLKITYPAHGSSKLDITRWGNKYEFIPDKLQ